MCRQIILIAAVATLFPFCSRADEVEELKAADETTVKAWNSLDVQAIMARWHPEIVGFWVSDKVPVIPSRDRAAFSKGMKAWLDAREEYSLEVTSAEYRVVGNTGVVVGFLRYSAKLRGQPRTGGVQRYVGTYTKQGGKWLQLAWHTSRVPE